MIKLLIIEDDPIQSAVIKSAVIAWNLENKLNRCNQIDADIIENDVDVYKMIFDTKYDCFALDINWGKGQEFAGGELAKKIINSKRVPIAVYSGDLSSIEDLEESIGFKKFNRSEVPFRQVLTFASEIKSKGIFDLIGNGGKVEQKMREIFWKDLQSITEYLEGIPENNDESVFTRIISTRLIDYLSSVDRNPQKYFEFYIHPSQKKRVANGDIYRFEETCNEEVVAEYYIVMTPVCKLVNNPPINNVNLVKIDNAHAKIQSIKTKETANNRVSAMSEVNKKDELHFIPPLNGVFEMGIADFSIVRTVRLSDLNVARQRVTTINPVYMKDIQSRFSQFFAKQGQPDIDFSHLERSIFTG